MSLNSWYNQITGDIFPLFFRFHDQILNKSNTMGATSGAWIPYPSGGPEFTPVFNGILVAQS